MDQVIGKIEVKGTTYTLYEGSKGGHYYLNANKRKVYVKDTPKKVEPKKTEPKKHRYIAYFEQVEDGCMVDDFKEWCDAYSVAEARDIFENRYYRSIERGTIRISMICEE